MILTWTYDDVDQSAGYGAIWTYSCAEPDVVLYPSVFLRVQLQQPVMRTEVKQSIIRVER